VLRNARTFLEAAHVPLRDGVPAHPRLRIVARPSTAGDAAVRYDAIVQSLAMTSLATPPQLFVVERLARIRASLRPRGVFVTSLQLWEVRQELHRRMLVSFADAFPQVGVFLPDVASVMILAGSAEPLAMPPSRLHALYDHPELARLRTGLATEKIRPYALETRRQPFRLYDAPLDLAAEAIFRDVAELRSWLGEGAAIHESDPPIEWPRAPQFSPGVDEDETLEAEVRWNDAYEAWVEAQGFEDGWWTPLFERGWRSGDLCRERGETCALVGRMTADDHAGLGRAYLASGRIEHAAAALAWALAQPEPGVLARRTERLLDALAGRLPVPATDVLTVVGAETIRTLRAQRFDSDAPDLVQLWATAVRAPIVPPAEAAADHLGPWNDVRGYIGWFLNGSDDCSPVRVLDAIAEERDGTYSPAVDQFRELCRPTCGLCDRHPSAWFHYALALQATDDHRRAADAMERWLARSTP
jgi:hypothetical protein